MALIGTKKRKAPAKRLRKPADGAAAAKQSLNKPPSSVRVASQAQWKMPDKRVYSSKKEMVYQSLRDEIVQGRLKPGERLIIDELATAHGVSHIPVREALQMLAADGFVDFRPHIGATVSNLDPNAVMEVFEVLEALEVVSSRAACRAASPEDFAELRALLEEMDGLLDRPDTWSAKNYLFHEMIGRAAGFPLATKLLDSVRIHWDRIRRRFFAHVFMQNLPEAQKEHWKILKALEARQPDRIAVLLHEHNQHARDSYRKAMPS